MSLSSNHQNVEKSSATILPLVTSIGVFITTATISLWLKHQYRNDEEHSRHLEDDEEYDEAEDLREWYQNRRLYDRMSYEDVKQLMPIQFEQPQHQQEKQGEHLKKDDNDPRLSPNSNHEINKESMSEVSELDVDDYGNDHHNEDNHNRRLYTTTRQRNSSNSPKRERYNNNPLLRNNVNKYIRRSTQQQQQQANVIDSHPNAEYDFHPKNRNWRHFEHFNEEDRKKRQSLANQLQSHLANGHNGCYNSNNNSEKHEDGSFFYEDGSYDDYHQDEPTTASSDGSGSSEEQFVWTSHQHRTSVVGSNGEKNILDWAKTKFADGINNLFEKEKERDVVSLGDINLRGEDNSSSSDGDRTPIAPSNNKRTLKKQRSWSSPSLKPLPKDSLMLNRSVSDFVDKTSGHSKKQRSPSNRIVRAQYNARIMPNKLVMVRHGQSMGNINETLYSKTPDNAMPLTDLGWAQAKMAGKVLKDKVIGSGQTVHFIVSPYVRTVETFHGLVSAWCDPKEFSHIQDRDQKVKAWYGRLMDMGLTWSEDSRIREQDFGNYQDPEKIKQAKRDRHRFGVFYYRFAHGESASDVFDRVSTFLDSLWRSFDMNRSQNYVLVTHGISIRVLLARYFRYTIDQFNMLANPRNCEMVVLEHDGNGKLDLNGRCQLELKEDETTKAKEVIGYEFHKRLRILPREAIRRLKIRISPDDD